MKNLGLFAAGLLTSAALLANGGVWGHTSHGLSFRKEPRVAMAKERLYISQKKIRVEYEFRNDSDRDVATDILFPLGEHDFVESSGGGLVGTHFKLWCDGKPKTGTLELKAILMDDDKTETERSDPFMNWGGRDVTALLKPYGLVHPDFGQSHAAKLNPRQLSRLWKEGILPFSAADGRSYLSSEEEMLADLAASRNNMVFDPNWVVYECHRWTQVFPARKQVHIALEYVPIPRSEGITYSIDDPNLCEERPLGGADMPNLEGDERSLHQEVVSQAQRLSRRVHAREDVEEDQIQHIWIEYILTTARTWKGPIEDFELVVEGGERTPLSFRWPRPLERLRRNTYRVKLKHFVPDQDIRVDFFPL